ncbi:MAG: hypothetical protein ACI8WT_001057 [Clostridium sp.]|jgi:hypothetical protein
MEMKGNKKALRNSKNGASDFILSVIANGDGGVHGKIQHCESGEIVYFRSLIEMIILINGKFEQLKLQQPTNKIRSWTIHKIPIALKGGRCYE